MKFIEKIKLIYRAYRYKNKNDIGGITYVLKTLKIGQTVLDIGAHKGAYLYFINKKLGTHAKIYAFEPQSNLFQYLNNMKSIMNWEHIHIHQLAISNIKNTATLYIPSSNNANASSPGATIYENNVLKNSQKTEQVETDTLDLFCEKNQLKPDFLKIDVEGNELSIFEGGQTILKNCKPKILVEIESRHVGNNRVFETFEFLKSLGYKGYFIFGKKHIDIDKFNLETYQNINDKKQYCNNFIFE